MAKRGKAATVRLIENIRKKGLHNGQKRAREAVPIRGLSLFLSAIEAKQDKTIFRTGGQPNCIRHNRRSVVYHSLPANDS